MLYTDFIRPINQVNLTADQIQLANKLLPLMLEHGGTLQIDQLTAFFVSQTDDALGDTKRWLKLKFDISIFAELNLVYWEDDDYHLKLKTSGIAAANKGIVEYLKELEEQQQRKHLTFQNSNVNFGVNTGQQNINQSDNTIKKIFIGLFVAIVGGLILYYLTK